MVEDTFIENRSRNEINFMLRLLANPSTSIRHVHVHGSLESGMSELFNLAFGDFKDKLERDTTHGMLFLEVSCLHAQDDTKLFFAHIKKQLSPYLSEVQDIDSFSTFADAIQELNRNDYIKRIYLILNDADALQKFSLNQLKTLFLIPSLIDKFFRIFTIAELAWSEIGNAMESVSAPNVIRIFPPSKEEIISMIHDKLEEVPNQFIRLSVETLYMHCKDANLLYGKVYDAWKISDRESQLADEFRNRNKIAIAALRSVESNDVLRVLMGKNEQTKTTIPLPLVARYLILAAFFAGQNSAASDKRFFTKCHGREKRNEAKERNAALVRSTTDPTGKQFDLTRLFMIYRSLLDLYPRKHESIVNVDCLVQVNSLVTMGLLQRMSATPNLDQLKFKCLLDAETAKAIAFSISEEFHIHLHLEEQRDY